MFLYLYQYLYLYPYLYIVLNVGPSDEWNLLRRLGQKEKTIWMWRKGTISLQAKKIQNPLLSLYNKMICWKNEWDGRPFNFHFYEQEYSWVFDPLVLTKQKKLLTLQCQCQNEFSWMLDKTKISFRTKLTLLLNFLLPVSWTRDPENIVISTVLPSDCRLND